MATAKQPLSPEKALYRAAALCSKCEQAESDIRAKLKTWGVSSSDCDSIIQSLLNENYINNERFARAFARDKFRFEGWGRIKIAYQLKLKQIPASTIEEAIAGIDEDEYMQSLEHILEVKARALKGKNDLQAKASLFRFAASRGFEPNLIYRLLPKYVSCNEDF